MMPNQLGQGADVEFGFGESRALGWSQGPDLEFGSWESRAPGWSPGPDLAFCYYLMPFAVIWCQPLLAQWKECLCRASP